jgi:6-pyruvoyltetrahydropterin/6-carboxytetrahydropterin synthase
MPKHVITRYHDFSAGHRVVGHESKCQYLHGHNYRVTFHVTGAGGTNLDELGRVIDFSIIKSTLCQWLEDNWDHKMILWSRDPILTIVEWGTPFLDSIVDVPFNPTAENMAEHLVRVVGPAILPPNVQLIRCDVEETRKCAATYIL